MKIGIDARYLAYSYTGIPVYVHDMIYYFNKEDSKNKYILYSDRRFELDFHLNNNFTMRIDGKNKGIMWVLMDLGKMLKEDEIDLFWEPMHFLPCRIQNIKTVLTVHDLAVYNHPEWGKRTNAINHRLFFKKSCIKADRIIAISNSTKSDINKYCGVGEHKIDVIYNGDCTYTEKISTELEKSLTQVLEKFDICQNNYFVFISTIEPRKNVVTMLKAYDFYRQTTKRTDKLVLVGKKGWKSNEFDKVLSKCVYKKDIILTGFVSDDEKEILLRMAKALLYPSLYEGFGFPVLEAMSVGTIVITSSVSSLPEVGGNAVFYLNEVYDYKELSSIMQEVSELTNDEKEEIVQKGYIQANKFSRKECADTILHLFEEIVE